MNWLDMTARTSLQRGASQQQGSSTFEKPDQTARNGQSDKEESEKEEQNKEQLRNSGKQLERDYGSLSKRRHKEREEQNSRGMTRDQPTYCQRSVRVYEQLPRPNLRDYTSKKSKTILFTLQFRKPVTSLERLQASNAHPLNPKPPFSGTLKTPKSNHAQSPKGLQQRQPTQLEPGSCGFGMRWE